MKISKYDVQNRLMKTLRDAGHAKNERILQAKKYCEATDLDFEKVSVGYMSSAVCIIPSAPYLYKDDSNDLILKKTKDKDKGYDPKFPEHAGINQTHGGWNLKRISERMSQDSGAGRLVVLDFDGTKDDLKLGTTGRKPLVSLVNKISSELGKLGMPSCVTEITTPDPNDVTRSKMHVTFKCSESVRAVSREDHEARYDTLEASVLEIVDQLAEELDLPKEEVDALILDPGLRQISRLKRLAGHAKEGKNNAVEVISTSPDAYVKWTSILETRPQTLNVNPMTRYTYGNIVRKSVWTVLKEKDGSQTIMEGHEDVSKSFTIARHIYPITSELDRESGHRAVRFRCHDIRENVHYESLSFSAFTNTNDKNTEMSRLIHKTIISPGKSDEFIKAINFYSNSSLSKKELTSTTLQGWQEDSEGNPVYINGNRCWGQDWIVKGKGAAKRSQRKGSLDGWKEGVETHISGSHGLLIALGISFSGCLVKPLGKASYIGHFFGESTVGKTTSMLAAASIWGQPKPGAMIGTWRTTDNRLEISAQNMSGACLIQDELKEFGTSQRDKESLRKVIMMIANGKGKGRMTSDIEERADLTWDLSLVSTGENSIKDWLGNLQQGGESVRAIDIHIQDGDLTKSFDHAKNIQEWSSANYGFAGNEFAEAIIGNVADIKTLDESLELQLRASCDDKELVRIMDSVSLIWTSLLVAHFYGILPDIITNDDIFESISWLRNNIEEGRGTVNTPATRALERLKDMMTVNPAAFPSETAYDSSYQSVVGVKQTDPTSGFGDVITPKSTGSFYTCESMIKGSGICLKAGISARAFLTWLEDQGISESSGTQTRIGSVRKRWHLITLDKDDNDGDEPLLKKHSVPEMVLPVE